MKKLITLTIILLSTLSINAQILHLTGTFIATINLDQQASENFKSVCHDLYFETALAAKTADQYEQAILGLEKALEFKPEEDRSRFELGILQLSLAEYSDAANQFASITVSDNIELQQAATFYLAFCVSESNVASAQKILSQITKNPAHPYYHKALTLNEEISN